MGIRGWMLSRRGITVTRVEDDLPEAGFHVIYRRTLVGVISLVPEVNRWVILFPTSIDSANGAGFLTKESAAIAVVDQLLKLHGTDAIPEMKMPGTDWLDPKNMKWLPKEKPARRRDSTMLRSRA